MRAIVVFPEGDKKDFSRRAKVVKFHFANSET